MATIKDVARETGLGIATISRYLNGVSIKKENHKLIEDAIGKLDYRQNPVARSMKTGKSMTIAVVVPNLANMFSMRVIESIERVLEDYGYSIIVSDCKNDPNRLYEKLSFLKNKMVDGFVLMPAATDAHKIKDIVFPLPLVLIDRLLDAPLFDSVVVNNQGAAYREVKKILETGIRKIAIIEGPESIYTARERKCGFEKVLLEFGIENTLRFCGGYSYDDGFKAYNKLMVHKPEAVFISNYELTVGALNAAFVYSHKPIIIGFDSPELRVPTLQPMIFISQPVEKIGEQAAQLLLEKMKQPSSEIKNIVIDI